MIFIADIGSNHDCKLERAKTLIKLAKDSGAGAVKFQLFRADTLINGEQFRKLQRQAHQKDWKESVYQTYKNYEMPVDWIPVLADECKRNEVLFMCTGYDLSMIDEIDKCVMIHKIGSGDITYAEMLLKVASKGKLALLATGASSLQEVIVAVNIYQSKNPQLGLMQCNTNYTGEINVKNINVNVLKLYKTLFPELPIGLSDHTKNNKTVLAAQALGAQWIERHFTDGKSESPDNDFSLDPFQWKYMITECQEMASILGNTFKEVQTNEYDTNVIQRRAWYPKRDLKAGTVIEPKDIVALRPAIGINPLMNIAGLKLEKDISKDEPFTEIHFKDKNVKQ